MLEEKIKAIDFTLPDKDGNKISLHDFLGKKVVLFDNKLKTEFVLLLTTINASLIFLFFNFEFKIK